ncbi:MAG: guided entry of tail-anchored proteins factor 1 [Candidatus Nitrosocosmicus sp.]|nr:guided entry of tail-anchored proteins factor 1 [Candidatus Nitrosocosmicus sp.]MDN5868339.1 guided entry of tail-anchored proteins factor 1 [Candidatus Nitrosocosmicus sp.]
MRYCNYQKVRIQKGEISEGTMRNYIKAIKLFCEMNEIHIFWKKITKGLPTPVQSSDDRPPTVEEISKLINGYPDLRLRVIVLTMISSGIRIGAWDYIRWKHIEPIYTTNETITNDLAKDRKTLLAAKLTVYAGTRDKYYSFLTPEAYLCIKDWVDFRQLHGENITGDSWLMRDTWQKIDRIHGHRIGLANMPRQFHSEGIRSLLDRAWKVQGIREKLDVNTKHHNFKSSHGFRKFFQTICEQTMISANVERLMGHSNGLKDSYYKPSETEVLNDYLKVINSLTINEENKLRNKLLELAEENQHNDNFIMKKIDEKDKQIDELRKEMEIKFKQLITKLDVQKIIPQQNLDIMTWLSIVDHVFL